MLYRFLGCCLLVALVSACQGYDFRVNDRVVYSPDPLFSNFELADPALLACVKQAVIDASVTAPGDLTVLNCSHAGIERLEGLAIFTGLTHLRLSANRVRNLVELEKLIALRELHLDDNAVVDPVPLSLLPNLDILDLSGNPALQCPGSGMFEQSEKVVLPHHCGGANSHGAGQTTTPDNVAAGR